MGCANSKKKEPEEAVNEGDANGNETTSGDPTIVISGKEAAKKAKEEAKAKLKLEKEKKAAAAKEKKKEKKESSKKGDKSKENSETNKDKCDNNNNNAGDKAETQSVTKNGKIGPNSAKVRPLTPTPTAPPETNVPKPVAFDVKFEQKEADEKQDTSEANGSGGYHLRLPRKLPKLSSLGRGSSVSSLTSSGQAPGGSGEPTITNEDIEKKQRKAEEKRAEILEEKKQKARKFVEKIGGNGNGNEASSGSRKQSTISLSNRSGKGPAKVESTESDDASTSEKDGGTIRSGMNGLDSGLGLDGYGLESYEGKNSAGKTRSVASASAPGSVEAVVVQDDSAMAAEERLVSAK